MNHLKKLDVKKLRSDFPKKIFFIRSSTLCFLKSFLCYRHSRQAADLPAKVAKRIGCAHKRGYSLEIGWSPIFVTILGHEFLVNFYVTFPCKTTYIALRTERSRDLSGKIPVDYIATGLLKQTNCNKCSSKTGLLRVHILFEKKGTVKHAVEEEPPFLCQLDCSLTLLYVALRRLDFDAIRLI